MSGWKKALDWLRENERPVSAGVALASLIVAVLASVASVIQAMLLVSQLWTPYRTALYVRQLEVAGDFHAAAHEQWAAIIDLNDQCVAYLNAGGGGGRDFWDLSERFREGSTKMHEAYSGAIATFPYELHDDALNVWRYNERLVEQVLTPATDCGVLVRLYREQGARQRAEQMNAAAEALVGDMRLLLRVDRWSNTDLDAQRRLAREREQRREREQGKQEQQPPPPAPQPSPQPNAQPVDTEPKP